MNFYFLNATDAAAELNRHESQRRWTPSQVLREAKAGRLPVCFDFAGELVMHSLDGKPEPAGVSPRVLDFDGVVRSLTPPSDDGVCGFGVLLEIQEAHKIKFCHKDGTRTRGIDLPTESPHGGRIKAGHKVECWLQDADIPTDAFLFGDDDLAKLVTATQAVPDAHVDPGRAAPASQAGPEPVTTTGIAHAFDGLGWSAEKWKKPLGDPPKWLQGSVAIKGQRGVREHRWNPVRLGAALIATKGIAAKSVRARFQRPNSPLAPWLDAWKTYEADYLDNDS